MYRVKFTSNVIKSFKKMDPHITKMMLGWIEKNLEGTSNPRSLGKSLSHDKKDIWRYRVGAYRILTQINDKNVTILIVHAGHRKDIYK